MNSLHFSLLTKLHQRACELGHDYYLDPETGFQVSTENALRARGHCCESGCRHCPYGFQKPIKTDKGLKTRTETER